MTERTNSVRTVYDRHKQGIRRRIVINLNIIASAIYLCLFGGEVGFNGGVEIVIPIKHCIALSEHIRDRVDNASSVTAINDLQAWIACFISRNIHKAAGGHQR